MAEVQPFQNYFRFLKLRDDPEKLAEEVKSFEASVANFEKFLEIHGDASGPFLCGEDFSFAEAMMAPFVQRCIPNLLHFVDVDCMAMVRRHPRVEALVTAILARPSVIATGVEEGEMIKSMESMLARFT
mmetsp:Transcript_35926/g.110208  ORF Transcript_35926/g.110208 Transcript_35926/m.110208 type:complete len:129 (+) Transcript_35926:348-734(+)